MQEEPLTVIVGGQEFTRQQIFDLVNTLTSPGWVEMERILNGWEDERLAELCIRGGFPIGMTLSDHLSITAGKMEMLGMFQHLPDEAKEAHANLRELEDDQARARGAM